jgi:uncharacterized membrane protein YkvA (DUF1232 family)
MLGKLIPNVFHPRFWKQTFKELKLIRALMQDPEVPSLWKVLPLLVGAYLVFPIDLIPGFIPVLGQLDDLTILWLGINLLPKLAPDSRVAAHRERLEKN